MPTSWKKIIMPWKLVDAHDPAHPGHANKSKLGKSTTRKRKVMANSCCNNSTSKPSHGLRELIMLHGGKVRVLRGSPESGPLPEIQDIMAELAITPNRGSVLVGAENLLSSCTASAMQAAGSALHRSCLFRETGAGAMLCGNDWSGLSEMTSSCTGCGSHFRKHKAFDEHYCANRTVVSLDENDSTHKIVEIIFNNSWLKDSPCGKIERIIKINNSPVTIAAFEQYRNSIKVKASKQLDSITKKHSRCIADGNELLRFHCAAIACNNITGLKGSSSGSSSSPCYLPSCHLCSILRSGFPNSYGGELGIYTTASSGKADDSFLLQQQQIRLVGGPYPPLREQTKKGMIVCRVIAGRVQKLVELGGHQEKDDPVSCYDSIAGPCTNLEELLVLNRSAVLPCFVVIYGGGNDGSRSGWSHHH